MYTNNYKKENNSCSQNSKQRIIIFFECIIEIYRVVIGTCLITFVPQRCGNIDCDHIWYVYGKTMVDIAYYINIGTLFCFLILFLVEMIRENRIINYLEVNPLLGTENTIVGEILQELDPVKRSKLYCIDTIYVGWSIFCLGCFGANTIVSGIVIIRNLDSNTISGFITNILFMFTKLYRIYFVIHTEKNVFYSAYLINFVQFNDLDPREIKWTENHNTETDVYEEDWRSVKEDIFEPDWVSNKNSVKIYI